MQQLMETNSEMEDMNYVCPYSCEDRILDLFICFKYTQQYASRKYSRVSFTMGLPSQMFGCKSNCHKKSTI
jgi:hypothetical protein